MVKRQLRGEGSLAFERGGPWSLVYSLKKGFQLLLAGA